MTDLYVVYTDGSSGEFSHCDSVRATNGVLSFFLDGYVRKVSIPLASLLRREEKS